MIIEMNGQTLDTTKPIYVYGRQYSKQNLSSWFPFRKNEKVIHPFNYYKFCCKQYILGQIPHTTTEWVWSSDMTDDEKKKHPEHETTGGYLKVIDKQPSAQSWWNDLSKREKKIIKDIPNFDAEIFEQITGVKTDD